MIKNKIDEARNFVSYLLAGGNKKSTFVGIEDIPTKWEQFLNTGDRWVELIIPKSENASSCLYHAQKGSKFPAHFHGTGEQCVIINQKGKFRYYTPKNNGVVEFPNSVYFPAGEENSHMIEFLEETVLLIIWKPKFHKGWDAEFLKETK